METEYADVEITFTECLPKLSGYSQNPSVHKYSSKQLQMKFGNIWVAWEYNKILEKKCLLIFAKLPKFNFIMYNLRRVISMEFASELERFVQILHELILVPSTYFFDDIVPIHAAAISSQSKCLLLAGTGGVGKSSGLLSIYDNPAFSFMADDIAIIDDSGGVYGNMAWPKIYGYNCKNSQIKKKLLGDRNNIDKLNFYIRNRINPSLARRKIRPNLLFKSTESGRKPLTNLVYLFRQDVEEISIDNLDPCNAAKLSCSVMEAEYSVFHNQIHWAEYNSDMQSSVSPLRMARVRKQWFDNYQSSFSVAKCVKIIIPARLGHEEYQVFINKFISSELN